MFSFAIIFESRNFRGVKNRGIIRVNDEMTRVSLTHNLKKIDNKVYILLRKTLLRIECNVYIDEKEAEDN